METILINPILLDLIKQGKKITTCRNGIRTYDLGNTILKSNASEDYAFIDITKLKYYKLKNVTDTMAKNDGFDNRENLIKVLKGIYEGINDESDVTIVHFNLISAKS